jgi:hypothetical protein
MVHSPKLTIIVNGKHQTSVGFITDGKHQIFFGGLEFITYHFSRLSFSPDGNDSGTVFVGVVHNGLPSLQTILEESTDEGDTASSGVGSSDFPVSWGCNVVTSSVPITTTPLLEGTPPPLTIAMVSLWAAIPQPDTRVLPKQQQAYQEEQ